VRPSLGIRPAEAFGRLCAQRIAGRITGDSGSTEMAGRVKDLVGDRRCMVVLDSDHTAKHVADEIALYGPLVSVGCHLVVEDGIVRWLSDLLFANGGPLDAVETLLAGNDEWDRNIYIERMFSVSMHPAGWWRRVSAGPGGAAGRSSGRT